MSTQGLTPATVYLVGAGPGDPGLLTVRGRELLQKASVVVYDYLASPELLALAREDAELVDVGKRGFAAHLTQDEINGLLVQKARGLCGKDASIVRLKGGDPFVFGRGAEEALALTHAGVPFEVVPGVTSGIAGPAYAGIPVTHRGVASSVTFVTGHEDPTRDATSINWSALSELLQYGNTICFYMGMRNLGNICQQLMAHGAAPGTPVALVRWATTAQQESLVSRLGDVEQSAREARFSAPAIIVVGRVAKMRDELSWFEKRPLAGKRIVVTRSRAQASELSARLACLGADVIEVPTIAFAEPDSYDALDDALRNIGSYQWVVFTSVNGVDAFFERAHRLSGPGACADARCLSAARVVCIGPATGKRLEHRGIIADVMPQKYCAESVFEAMRNAGLAAGERVLIARAQQAREVLPELLRNAGAQVDVAAAYKTVVPEDGARELACVLAAKDVDGITFTSSSTVRNLLSMLGDDAARLLQDVALFSIGPITSQTLREAGLEPAAQADEYTIDGLVKALLQEAPLGSRRHARDKDAGTGKDR